MNIDGPSFKNFDAIRLFAASTVIFSHGFLIADGNEDAEPFKRLTGAILGIHGVAIFLIVSGFLVSHSLRHSPTLRDFAWKRLLRIYPALLGCALVCAFLIAPWFSDLGALHYLVTHHGLAYVAKVLLMFDVYDIPTVRFYEVDTDLGTSVNGSLWTILMELVCYVLLLGLAATRLLDWRVTLAILALFTSLFAVMLKGFIGVDTFSENLLYVVPPFCAGILMYMLYRRRALSPWLALTCVAMMIAVAPTGYFLTVFPLLAAYPLVYLGTSRAIPVGGAAAFGDVSYGTYLYGWPVEQMVRVYLGDAATGWSVTLLSLPIAIAMGWLSWHLIERHAKRFKSWSRHWKVESLSEGGPRGEHPASRPDGAPLALASAQVD